VRLKSSKNRSRDRGRVVVQYRAHRTSREHRTPTSAGSSRLDFLRRCVRVHADLERSLAQRRQGGQHSTNGTWPPTGSAK
jgi:hypothetical protein